MSTAPSIAPLLYARQKERGGYLTEGDLRSVADELAVPLYRIQSVISFFPHFRLTTPPQVDVHICRDMSCHLRGSVPMTERLAGWAQSQHGGQVQVCGVSCLGRCDRSPAAMVNEHLFVGRDEQEMRQIIDQFIAGTPPPANTDLEVSADHIGKWNMDVYDGEPRYEVIHNYLKDPDPDAVLGALENAGLLGMGGAGGRAYLKWGDVLRAAGSDKFIVCNADESEPGTFKDREILLAAPYLTLEGMMLAGLMVGASRGWVYIRHEYHEQIERVQREIKRASEMNALGPNIFDSGRSFYLDVFVSPGGYICGEQTALIEAMEDRRAEPRNRPPELMTNGYQNQPTLLSNVETFAWVPAIMLRSAGQWYAEQGRKSGPWVPRDSGDRMKGMRLFSISGDVKRPGAYEVPTGIPLGELIDEFCGGMADKKELAAVALSGPSGGFLPPKIPVSQLSRRFVEAHVPDGVTEIDVRDIPLDITVSRALGLMIGAGLVVYGTGADLLAEAIACSRFFRNESCGKCVPCRLGSQKITQMGEQIMEGHVDRQELPVLRDTAMQLSQIMTATSICGLGQVASNPVLSLLKYFPAELKRACHGAARSIAMAEPTKAAVDFSALVDETTRPYDEEGLFARDVDGQLIRVVKATASDFDADVHLKINGHDFTIKKALPQRDSQGNIIRDKAGQPIPRYSTIYDAASNAFVKKPGDRNPIPTLCHKEHLPPAGVCRVCVVEAAELTRRGLRKMLVPACVQRVSEGMEVHTLDSTADPEAAARVRAATGTIVELLVADHLPSDNGKCLSTQQAGPGNELAELADRLGIAQSRFAPRPINRGRDSSSLMINVDHDQCILCGRCMRGCNWLKHNNVIGQTGKGYATVVSFDLNQAMGTSSCVSCGECAISCPTGALEFTDGFIKTQIERVGESLREAHQAGEVIAADELAKMPLFSGIPYKFLQFNGGAVVRRKLKKGDVLCREGDYGTTAFILLSGRFEVFISTSRGAAQSEQAKGVRGWFGGIRTFSQKLGGKARLTDVHAATLDENERIILTPDDFILGESACMNRYPRSATVTSIEDAEVLEIRRNVLHMLQRNAVSREILDRVYRSRSLEGQLKNLPILQGLDETSRQRAVEYLRDKADIVFVEPGQVILAQGDPAQNFYMTKLGFVKVTQAYGLEERVLNYLGPGRYFGEIGLLSRASHLLADELGEGTPSGICTATCSALDHVELVRIRGEHFIRLLNEFPELVEPLKATAVELLRGNEKTQKRIEAAGSQDFLDQGLYLAQSLLVLDLERCTRCDECTKACADTHDGVTRLVRDGMRFDRFLVASSCRSCLDPYCLVGCPVDAIHRNGDTLEISISDYCIGCGLCAENCPYGNINMHGFPKTEIDSKTGRERPVYQEQAGKRLPVIQQRATTCDLCRSVDGRPSCVYACPHNAAFRVTGQELLQLVEVS